MGPVLYKADYKASLVHTICIFTALHTRSIAQHPSQQESRSPTRLDGERAGLLLRLLSLPRLLLLLRLLERLGV